MIKNFKHRGLKKLFEDGDRSKVRADHVQKIETILAHLDAAEEIDNMGLPGFHLHTLKGDRAGFWSVTVRANWRIIFRFENGTAYDVDLIDYH
jgi:toxin HigB-1